MIQAERGDRDQAIRVLEDCLRLPGVRQASNQTSTSPAVTVEDRASVFLLLVELYGKSGRAGEASSLLGEAAREFKNSKQEVRILIAQAELQTARGDVDRALQLLENALVQMGSEQTGQAAQFKVIKREQARLYLDHKNDSRSFARCHREILDQDPEDVQNYLSLGEALLEICEPQEAIAVFEKALAFSAEDKRIDATELIRKIGGALVLTHDYETAMNYYANALKRDPSATELRLDLARLHMRLQSWSRAGGELEDALSKIQGDNVKTLRQKIEVLLTLATVHLESTVASSSSSSRNFGASGGTTGDLAPAPLAAEKLKYALTLQKELVDRLSMEEDRRDKLSYADIAFRLAEYYTSRERSPQQAADYYRECLSFHESHEKAMLALAKLHMAEGNYEACEQQLGVLLRLESSSEEAVEGSTLMAELLMLLAANGSRSEGGAQEYRDATFHYRRLLEKKPCDWKSLSRLVYLLKRAGKLKEFERYLLNAEKHLRSYKDPQQEPGFRFCRGLYARCMNRGSEALVDLNFARTRDVEWRREATLEMIELYLFPDPNKLSLDALQDGEGHGEHVYREVDLLINELLQNESSAIGAASRQRESFQRDLLGRLRVYQASNAIFTKRKTEVDRGLQMLMELFNADKNYVPAVLAMSQGLIISKQLTKARNQLKRIAEIARQSYNPDWADDFEKAWLLLADVYISGGKYELASTLCHLASTHNRSSGKAWESLGLIYEKEAGHKEAATYYEKSWELARSTNVGFRLAFNYLKAKRMIECILICQQVLKMNPQYPKIQKEILDKARMALRS
ncbi:unnamed protein product [Amoebophrya sp. A25]|nr:unnamed protein product [Amoebophrya sp. A25]|eukprot:GSA25T00022497001.1